MLPLPMTALWSDYYHARFQVQSIVIFWIIQLLMFFFSSPFDSRTVTQRFIIHFLWIVILWGMFGLPWAIVIHRYIRFMILAVPRYSLCEHNVKNTSCNFILWRIVCEMRLPSAKNLFPWVIILISNFASYKSGWKSLKDPAKMLWEVMWGTLTLIPAWISNYIPSKVWDEITYPFPNFNGVSVEVWEWISNFIKHFIMHVITYPCRD